MEEKPPDCKEEEFCVPEALKDRSPKELSFGVGVGVTG